MIKQSEVWGCLILAVLTSLPAFAGQSPDQIVQSLQSQSPAGLSGHVSVLSAGTDIIATVTVSQATADSDLKKFAAELSARILGDSDSHIDRLVLVYDGTAVDRVKSITITRSQWDLIKGTPDPPSQLALDDGIRATGDFRPPVAAVAPSANPYANMAVPTEIVVSPEASHAPPELADTRAKLVERLELLQKKGVGTQPYLAILSESETNFKNGNVEAGKECLARLDNSLKDQEKSLSSRSTVRLKTGVSQSVAFQGLPAAPNLSPDTPAAGAASAAPNLKAGTPSTDDLFATVLGNHSVTELKGSESSVAETLARTLLGKTLGEDCPNDGPFLFERIRLSTRIHELAVKKVNVSSYRIFDRDRIESLIQSKDPRTLKIVAENIKYLDRILGLETLEKNEPKRKI